MRYKVKCQQVVSKSCFICGEQNKKGMKMPFYVLEGGEVAAVFTAEEGYNSYPQVVHGGVTAAILDETIGRAGDPVQNPAVLFVTLELSVRYKKPVPVGGRLVCIGRITESNSRIYIGTGEIYAPDGAVLATAVGKYMKVDGKKMFSDGADCLYVSKTHPELEFIDIPWVNA